VSKRLTDRERLLRSITEAEWQRTVISYAQAHGWLVAHFRPAMVGDKHMTAVTADGAGFPDLVMARGGAVVFAELKRETGRPTKEQDRWLGELSNIDAECEGTHMVRLWRPSDQDEMQRCLR
jgi:hypothetical protein